MAEVRGRVAGEVGSGVRGLKINIYFLHPYIIYFIKCIKYFIIRTQFISIDELFDIR